MNSVAQASTWRNGTTLKPAHPAAYANHVSSCTSNLHVTNNNDFIYLIIASSTLFYNVLTHLPSENVYVSLYNQIKVCNIPKTAPQPHGPGVCASLGCTATWNLMTLTVQNVESTNYVKLVQECLCQVQRPLLFNHYTYRFVLTYM